MVSSREPANSVPFPIFSSYVTAESSDETTDDTDSNFILSPLPSPVQRPSALRLEQTVQVAPIIQPSQSSQPEVWPGTYGMNLDSLISLPVDHRVCYYPGLVHGGLLTTLLDNAFTKCCSPAVPSALHIDFLHPVYPGTMVTIRVRTLKSENEKIELEGSLESDCGDCGEMKVVVKASATFVMPEWTQGEHTKRDEDGE